MDRFTVYSRDQLFTFRLAGGLTVPRFVRKKLFRLHPRRHRVPRISGLPQEGVSTRGRSPGIPVGDASRVHSAPITSAGQSPGGVPSRIPTDASPATAAPPAGPAGRRLTPVGYLSIARLNARSIRNKSADVCDVIKQHGIDLFIIVESWHEQENDLSVRSIRPDGYRSLDAPRSSSGSISAGQQRGGVVLLYRDNISAKRITIDLVPRTFEFLLSMIKLPRSNVVVLAVYRTGPITAVFYDGLSSMLELLVLYSCPIVITGDLNIHLDVPDDVNTVKLRNLLDSFGLIQSVREPTHLLGRTLDVVITRSDLQTPVVRFGLPGEISDHSLLLVSLQLPRPPVCFIDVTTRAWKNFDEEAFRDELRASSLCSPPAYEGFSVDELQDLYDSTLQTLIDKHAPSRKARYRHQPMTPWFDSECSKAKRRTRTFEQRYRRSRLETDRLAWITQARKKQQLYASRQSLFWERKISESKGDPKKLWRNLSSLLRRGKTKPPTSDELTAERFLEAFNEKLAGVRSSTASAAPPVFDGPPCEFSCVEFEPIDATTVQRLLSHAACKSCELDPVPTWVVQKFAVELSPFISALFNASMRSGVFPASQKLASITPVLKKASLDPLDLSNYRPISNLTFLSKLLERAVHEQITGYLDSHHLLPETQSAYRKNRSTETATIKVMSDAYQAADAGLVTLLGLLDLSAAFDTVDHQILLNRLTHEYGITGRVIEWIQSYLTGRTQFIRFNGTTSRTMAVTSGVPQSSVLGPVLFIAYSAGVINIVEHHGLRAHGYADDLQVYGHVAQDDVSSLVVRMVACIEHVKPWMTSNRLRLNPSKTELIWLGSSRRLHHCPADKVRISDADIQPVESVRDLGVLIDSAMTLTTHVNHLVGTCFFQLRQIRIIRRSLTTDAAHSLVRALIHARVDYCNGLLASCPKYLTDKLQSVLRAAARLVLQVPYRSSVTDLMHQQLHWLDIQGRVRYKIGLLVYKCLHGLAPRYLSDYCVPVQVSSTRSSLRSARFQERLLIVP